MAIDFLGINKHFLEKRFTTYINQELREIGAAARQEYLDIMQTLPLHSQNERFDLENLKEGPWRKTAIGGTNGLGENISQVMQTTYFSEADTKYRYISNAAKKLIKIRNFLSGLPTEFGTNPRSDKFWNAVRIHHYPSGGGHMQKHRDTHFSIALENQGHTYAQVCMLLSSKSIHFDFGGFNVFDKQNNRHELEHLDGVGRIIIFDGRLNHNVEDVDNHKVLDWGSASGRIALFVSLYEYRAN